MFNDGNSLPNECRLPYLLESHMFSITVTAMNSGTVQEGDMTSFFCSEARTGAMYNSGENVSPPTTGL